MDKLEELKENSKKEISSVFEYDGVSVEIVEFATCHDCHLEDTGVCTEMTCNWASREDSTSVIYKEVKL